MATASRRVQFAAQEHTHTACTTGACRYTSGRRHRLYLAGSDHAESALRYGGRQYGALGLVVVPPWSCGPTDTVNPQSDHN
eukprot:3037039-Rhodomonas_salina.1